MRKAGFLNKLLFRSDLVTIVLVMFCLCSNIFAQEKKDVFNITNYFSPQYRDFQMMKISIVPPQGFVRDTDQVGFLDSKNAAAIRAEVIKHGILSTSADFFNLFDSNQRNDSLGLKMLESFNFRINGYEAHLVDLSGSVEGSEYLQWWMLIGDSTETYVVKSFIPLTKKGELEQRVRTALLSIFYEPERRLIPVGVDPTTTGTSSCNCHNKN